MSYILDALKKSEQERNKQQRTGPRSPHPSGRSLPPRKNRIVPALIITSFLMLSVIIMGGGAWLALRDEPGEQRAAPSATSGPAQAGAPQPAAGGPQPVAAADPEQAVSTQARAHIGTRTGAPEDQDTKNGQSAASAEPGTRPPAIVSDAQASVRSIPDPAAEQPVPGGQPGSVKELPLISELEFSTRSMLPEMKFRGHAYSSTPAKRMIMINSMIVREGDTVAPDLRLKEITEDGLIMSFRGIDFRVELFRSQPR
ncbi:MAG: general secretion pathway protein GspB [Desulfofustis sp.]|nr:general secretion pathway protein GspB [Desulfofustis sp.]